MKNNTIIIFEKVIQYNLSNYIILRGNNCAIELNIRKYSRIFGILRKEKINIEKYTKILVKKLKIF